MAPLGLEQNVHVPSNFLAKIHPTPDLSILYYGYICKVKKIIFNRLMKEAPEQQELIQWLLRCAQMYDVSIKKLMYTFLSKNEMADLNQKFLNHTTDTDIITFSYHKNSSVDAEVFISSDMCRENALFFSKTIENELLRLISHGFLHTIGFNDKEEKEKDLMHKEEERCIKMFHVKHQANV